MKIADLLQACEKPALYTPGTALMWPDPYISKKLLALHLSQDTDLASRKASAIGTTLEYILARAGTQPLAILDLGCGPGLYAEKLAAQGHQVTGIDMSPSAIAYARKIAARDHLNITYLHQDYLTLDHENRYDLAILIFTDLGVLFPEERDSLLSRIYRALKPGGLFIFDVLNTSWAPGQGTTWEAAANGFWRPGPYLTLSQNLTYEQTPDQGIFLSQHVVVEDHGLAVYRFYTHTFSQEALNRLMTRHGFKNLSFTDNLLPDSDLYRTSDVTFVTAVR